LKEKSMGLPETRNDPAPGMTAPQGATPQKRFGIDRAIQLMRSLPTEQNPELVAMVITGTLESLDMNVSDIIEDANARAMELEARIASIKARNSALEKEIELGVDEIVKLEASLAEAMNVKDRIQSAHNQQVTRKRPTGP
jgi:predicted  nucleic acid-binding Zn-ribbon protein